MMFLAHIAFSTIIVTSVLGLALIAWSKKDPAAAGLLKTGGIVILVLSLSNMLCASYYAIRYWEDGYFKQPAVISYDMQGGAAMMNCPMMQKMTGKAMMSAPTGAESEAVSPEDHEAHH